jgi:ribosomal protein L11 methylase PrmA
MSRENIERILARAILEPDFRALLFDRPDTAFRDYELSENEAAGLKRLTLERFEAVVGGLILHRLQPFRVGRRFVIAPAWFDLTAADGYRVIRLDQTQTGAHLDLEGKLLPQGGPSFGSGTHPSTQLCLIALEERVVPGARMLDVGTGSGILAIAGARLGASAVLALDIEPRSIEVAQRNVDLNDMEEVVKVVYGSLDALHAVDGLVPFDVIVVNISAPAIVALLRRGLAKSLRPEGSLILAGFLERQAPAVEEALQETGLCVAARREPAREMPKKWVALIAQRAMTERES